MPTLKQRASGLDFDNLGEVLRASPKSATRKGTQQFETPDAIARALAMPLPPCRPVVVDLQCGHGALLRGTADVSCGTLLGIDIDPTARIGTADKRSSALIPDSEISVPQRSSAVLQNIKTSIIHGDCTRIVPLMDVAGLRFDLFVLNPPFSLQWPAHQWDRPIPNTFPYPLMCIEPNPETIDSTLWTFEAAHRLLSARGEGYLICNAATCRRLLEPHPLWRKTWLRLTCPNFFPGVGDPRKPELQLSIIYFAQTHDGTAPLEIVL